MPGRAAPDRIALAIAEGFAGKWVELFRDAVPRAPRAAVLVNPQQPAASAARSEIEMAAARLGVSLISFPVQDVKELDGTFATMARHGVDGLIVLTEPLTLRHRVRIVGLGLTIPPSVLVRVDE